MSRMSKVAVAVAAVLPMLRIIGSAPADVLLHDDLCAAQSGETGEPACALQALQTARRSLRQGPSEVADGTTEDADVPDGGAAAASLKKVMEGVGEHIKTSVKHRLDREAEAWQQGQRLATAAHDALTDALRKRASRLEAALANLREQVADALRHLRASDQEEQAALLLLPEPSTPTDATSKGLSGVHEHRLTDLREQVSNAISQAIMARTQRLAAVPEALERALDLTKTALQTTAEHLDEAASKVEAARVQEALQTTAQRLRNLLAEVTEHGPLEVARIRSLYNEIIGNLTHAVTKSETPAAREVFLLVKALNQQTPEHDELSEAGDNTASAKSGPPEVAAAMRSWVQEVITKAAAERSNKLEQRAETLQKRLGQAGQVLKQAAEQAAEQLRQRLQPEGKGTVEDDSV